MSVFKKIKDVLFDIEDDEEEMELPTLKTEEEKTFSFDDVNGETYDVK